MHHQSFLTLKQDLLSRLHSLTVERLDQDDRLHAFKDEFTKVLEERERCREVNEKLQGEIESLTEEIIHEKREHMEFYERIRMQIGGHYQSFGTGQG